MTRIPAEASAPSSRGATAVSIGLRNSRAASSASKLVLRSPKFPSLGRLSTAVRSSSARRSRTMWLRSQIVSASRTATLAPQWLASRDSATRVSAAERTGVSAGESVTHGTVFPGRGG